MRQARITKTGTVLDRIMAHKFDEVAAMKARRPAEELRAMLDDAPAPCDFIAALQGDHVALIAELKKASPSKGQFLEYFDPVAIGKTYHQHGASAISVLTDEHFFQGHLDYLRAVREALPLPILRKEFILDPYQVLEARVAGADAILLIVACLADELLAELHAAATELGMAVLVEVHDQAEMERALSISPHLVGINNRDLHDFSVDLNTTVQLAPMCSDDVTLVGESGIYSAQDVAQLAVAGVHAVLVGESLILADDRAAKVKELSGVQQ